MKTGVQYRWSCPYCDASRVSQGNDDEQRVRDRARSALIGHVSASEGDEHGPRHSVPKGFDPARYVERVLE